MRKVVSRGGVQLVSAAAYQVAVDSEPSSFLIRQAVLVKVVGGARATHITPQLVLPPVREILPETVVAVVWMTSA